MLARAFVLVSLCYFVLGQAENCYIDCAIVDSCGPSSCGPVWSEDGCCRFCCDEGCASCLVDPCENYFCRDDASWVCESNYCGGCNREWYDEQGTFHLCSEEVFVTPNAKWDVSCNENSDCSLQNEETGFSCCFEGACESIDYSDDKWAPVNYEWWLGHHKACSVDCGPAPLCPDVQPTGTNWEAHCIGQACTKLDTNGNEPSVSTNGDESSFSSVSTDSSFSYSNESPISTASSSSSSFSFSLFGGDDDDDSNPTESSNAIILQSTLGLLLLFLF